MARVERQRSERDAQHDRDQHDLVQRLVLGKKDEAGGAPQQAGDDGQHDPAAGPALHLVDDFHRVPETVGDAHPREGFEEDQHEPAHQQVLLHRIPQHHDQRECADDADEHRLRHLPVHRRHDAGEDLLLALLARFDRKAEPG